MIPLDVVSYFANRKNIPIEQAKLVFDELDLFLHKVKNRQVSNPTKDVDEAWHYFILHTRLYAEYCKSDLKTFIHHNPSKDLVNADCDAQEGADLID